MPFSTTYIASIVGLLAVVLPMLGIEIGTEGLTEVVSAVVTVGTFAYVIYRRFNQGDITIAGVKK